MANATSAGPPELASTSAFFVHGRELVAMGIVLSSSVNRFEHRLAGSDEKGALLSRKGGSWQTFDGLFYGMQEQQLFGKRCHPRGPCLRVLAPLSALEAKLL